MKKATLLAVLAMISQLVLAQSWENFVHPEAITDYVETNNSIWFSSKAGVVQVDKTTLQTTHYDKATANLPSNEVEAITEDNSGSIWIGTYNQAIAKFDGTTWTTYDFSSLFTASNVLTYCIEVDNQNIVWVGTDKGLLRFDGTTWQLYETQDVGSMFHDVWAMEIDSQGDLYLASFSVYKFDGTTFQNMTDTTGIFIYGNAFLFEDANNNIWVNNTFGTIGKFDGSTWTEYSSSNGQIPFVGTLTMGETPNGDIYFTAQDSGKYILQNGNWVQDNILATIPLDEGNLTTYFFDNQGNEWLGNDLNLIRNNNQNITAIQIITPTIAGNNVQDVEVYNGIQYFVSNKIINTYDGTTWGTFDFPDSLFGSWYNLSQIEIIDMDNIWINATNRGILHWNGTAWTLYNDANTILPGYVREILYDEQTQTLWCATGFGLFQFDGTTWTAYTSSNTLLGDDFIRAFTLDNNGVLYVTVTVSGIAEVWRYDGASWINIATGATAPQDQITALHFDKDNTLWAGGFDGDVYKYNGLSWEMWNIATSATSNVIVSTITSDSEGNIYAGSRINAAMFDGTTWTTWTMENSGLSYRQVQDIEVYNNKVWLATTHGVSALQLTTMNTTPIISQNESINVYPNPILDNAIVRFTTVEKTAQIQVNVVSLDGRTIQEMIIAGNRPKGEQQLDIQKGNLSKGMYYLQIRYNNKQLTKAILIN